MQPLLNDLAALNRDLRLIIEQDRCIPPGPVEPRPSPCARANSSADLDYPRPGLAHWGDRDFVDFSRVPDVAWSSGEWFQGCLTRDRPAAETFRTSLISCRPCGRLLLLRLIPATAATAAATALAAARALAAPTGGSRRVRDRRGPRLAHSFLAQTFVLLVVLHAWTMIFCHPCLLS